jgi:hypothetical protein
MDNRQWTIRDLVLALCIVSCTLSVVACSIPAIESSDCTAARDVAKRYYSLAIGGDLANQPDSMTQFKKLLAPNFSVSGTDLGGGRDPYNFSLITPSSSRFDECAVQQDGKPTINVTVIWRHNDQNYLRKDKVTLLKSGDTWLVEHIDVGPQPAPNF